MAAFTDPFIDQWGSGGTEFPSEFNNPSTGENNVPASGSLTHNWSSPGNIVQELNMGTSTLSSSGGIPYTFPYIRASDFGFAIPTGATIVGIEAEVIWGADNGGSDYSESDIRLAWGASAVNLSTTNKSTGATLSMGTGTNTIYGGPSDLWGELASTLTPTVLNTTDFGWVFKAIRTDSSTFTKSISIDCMRVKVYYTSAEPLAGAVRVTQTEALVFVTEALPVFVTQAYSEVLAGIAIPKNIPAGRRQLIIST